MCAAIATMAAPFIWLLARIYCSYDNIIVIYVYACMRYRLNRYVIFFPPRILYIFLCSMEFRIKNSDRIFHNYTTTSEQQ